MQLSIQRDTYVHTNLIQKQTNRIPGKFHENYGQIAAGSLCQFGLPCIVLSEPSKYLKTIEGDSTVFAFTNHHCGTFTIRRILFYLQIERKPEVMHT